jgi:hypothetical protein
MTLHKYINLMLLLKNQLIYPFLWYCLPFFYHCSLHLSFIRRLVFSSMQCLLNSPLILLN